MKKSLLTSCLLVVAALLLAWPQQRQQTETELAVTVHPTLLQPGDVARIELNPAASFLSATLTWQSEEIILAPFRTGGWQPLSVFQETWRQANTRPS